MSFFLFRSSQQSSASLQPRINTLCDCVREEVERTCNRTNQWFLLCDMLETRNCSPYLLAESSSMAWVEETVQQKQGVAGHTPSEFRPQEFHCELQWRKHITPHWRLKAMKSKGNYNVREFLPINTTIYLQCKLLFVLPGQLSMPLL